MTSRRRHHPISGEPVLFAPDRAERPNAFGEAAFQETCPFCPGNETLTPPEIERVGSERWRARVFPNKYPAAAQHEVIVESADHEATFDVLDHASEVVRLYARRYGAMMERGAACASLFKNHGHAAGASIPHLHAQLLGLEFVPPRLERELAAFRAMSHCPLCHAVEQHRREGLVIRETDWFVWFAPAAAAMPHEQWIAPKRHQHEMTTLTDSETADLAAVLQSATAAMQRHWRAHNWLFMNFPREGNAHFYVRLFPRLAVIAGFELQSGSFIQVIDPVETARLLRES